MSTLPPDERILTDRLDLRPVTVDDADELAAIFADKRLYALTGGNPSTLEALRSTFDRIAAARTAAPPHSSTGSCAIGPMTQRSGWCRASSATTAMRLGSHG